MYMPTAPHTQKRQVFIASQKTRSDLTAIAIYSIQLALLLNTEPSHTSFFLTPSLVVVYSTGNREELLAQRLKISRLLLNGHTQREKYICLPVTN